MKPTIETGNVSQQPECLRDMVVNRSCVKCKTEVTMSVNYEDVEKRAQGAPIQDAFPYLTPAEREMFITGICGKCWDNMFSQPMKDMGDGTHIPSPAYCQRCGGDAKKNEGLCEMCYEEHVQNVAANDEPAPEEETQDCKPLINIFCSNCIDGKCNHATEGYCPQKCENFHPIEDTDEEPSDEQREATEPDPVEKVLEEMEEEALEKLDKLQRAAWEESQAIGREASDARAAMDQSYHGRCAYDSNSPSTSKCALCGVGLCDSCGSKTLGGLTLCNACFEMDPR